MKKYLTIFTFLFLITVIFTAIYAAGQQILRQHANDPQTQIAEDVAASLNAGQKPSMLASGKVDMNTSLASFIIIYDKTGKVAAGSGYLNGVIPLVPRGVLSASAGIPYNAVTWQPQSDVRIAAVVVNAHNYYVLSGRSLREVEKRENSLLGLVGAAWLVAMIGFTGLSVVRRNAVTAKSRAH